MAESPVVDAAAARRVRERLAAAAEPPWLHREVARRMAERLSIVKRTPARVLDWWGDVGGSGGVLAQAYPRARIATVRGGAATARRRAWPWRRGPVAIDAAEVEDGAAELVWSNMALHFAADLQALPDAWLRALQVDGFLMFSTLGPDTLRELREPYAAAGWGPPHARFEDMHDLGDRLVHAGFADPVMDQEQLRLTYPSAEALLAELRTLGGNLDPARHPGLRTPRWRRRWLDAVGALAGGDGRIALTFEVAYGHAFKPAPRLRVEPETRVALDRMRALLRRPAPGATPESHPGGAPAQCG